MMVDRLTTAEGVPTEVAYDPVLASHMKVKSRTNFAKKLLDQANKEAGENSEGKEFYLEFPTPTQVDEIRTEMVRKRAEITKKNQQLAKQTK